MATKKSETAASDDIMSLFNASMGEMLEENAPVPFWYDWGNYALNYICSKNLRHGLPASRIFAIQGTSGTGKSLFCCNVLRDSKIDMAFIIDSEGGGLNKELLDYAGVDINKVRILKAHTFECYKTNKKNQVIEQVAEKDMPKKLETDQYIYTPGVTYIVKSIIDTIVYNPVLKTKKIVIILDSLANCQSVREIGGFDMGARSVQIGKFFRTFDTLLNKTNIAFIFTNKLYQDINSTSMYGPTMVAAGGQSVIYNPSITIQLAETAATDDATDADIKKNKEGKQGGEGTSFKTLTASVVKSRFGCENRRCQIMLEAATGVSRLSGLFKLLKDYGIIEQSGSFYSCKPIWGDTKFFKKDFISKFRENENENIDKLQTALEEYEKVVRDEKIKELQESITPENDDEAEVEDNNVDVNDMISMLEG